MPVPFASNGARAAALVLAGTAASATTPASLDFDRTFAAAAEPHDLHASVLFVGGGAVHRMELWRDGERRLRRDTDGRITTLATRTAGAGYDLLVLDHVRRISTRVSRDNLYRIGSFTDWFDLGHGLRHPHPGYRLTASLQPAPATLPATAAPCRWYDLSQGTTTTHLCWDGRDRFPMLVADAAWRPLWRVVAIDRHAIATGRFAADDRGYVRNDANRDVEDD